MRILSFSKRWQKLSNPTFTTFRFPRKDKDWFVGEVVQVWLKTRSPEREYICEAVIVAKNYLPLYFVTNAEAREDGFANKRDMFMWVLKAHGGKRAVAENFMMNKLTLRHH